MQQWAASSGKRVVEAVCCHPAYLTYMQSTSCEMPGWMSHKLESRLRTEISITSDRPDDTTLMAESEEGLKSLLMKVKEESEKAGLKLNTQKTKLMASGPISSWQNGKAMETVTDFIFLHSKITVDGECSHEIKTLAPCKNSYDKPLQCIKKQRRHFADKGLSSQSYGFSSSHVWM